LLRTSDFRCAAALSCAAALFLSGCATPCKTTVEPGRHSLTQGVPVQVSRNTQLTLVAIDDSRCPAGVRCIWAGNIVYRFELKACGNTERFALTPPGQASTPGNQHIRILESAPSMFVTLTQGALPPRDASASGPVRSVSVVLGAN
jgi:hypothetical protein